MDIKGVISTTKSFYKNISDEFSNTRQYPWKRWGSVLTAIDLPENAKILDIACGNGRFFEFLQANTAKPFIYLGVDADKTLLTLAKAKYPLAKFQERDVLKDLVPEDLVPKYDLVVAFGLTHHIPDQKFRLEWFKNTAKLVQKNGYLVLSFWNFLDKKSLVRATELEENDYWLGWGDKNIKRYCHYYDKTELKAIQEILKNSNLTLEKELSDTTSDLNTYQIYRYT